MIAGLLILFLLQIADIWSTYKILNRGGREMNKLVKWFMRRFGTLRGLIISKMAIAVPGIAVLWHFRDLPIAQFGTLAAIVVYAIVCVRHLKIIHFKN